MKKWSFAHTCAYISLAISTTLLVLWCCNVGGFTVVSLDSFVGVMVSLLAIVVTLAVGWQIYNSIELNDRIKKLSTLEEKLRKQEKVIEQKNNKSNHLITFLFGVEANNQEEYIEAFRYYMASLQCTIILDKPINVEHLLKDIEKATSKIKEGSICEHERLVEIQKYNNNIRESSCYEIIKSRYESIYNDFISKIKEQ